MHEDINHSGDGGIYAEMIANRAFQGSSVNIGAIPGFSGSLITGSENPIVPFDPVITAWGAIGEGVRMTLDVLHPLDALPTSLQIDIPENATGEVGFENYGWWGFDVRPQQYNVSFYALGNFPRNMNNATTFTVSFRSNTTNEVYASSTLDSVNLPFVDFAQLNTTLVPNCTAPDSNNKFVITMDGAANAGRTYYFNLVSVLPETFKGYQNGLRNDIASAFYDIQPRFLRFPGGNNLEGYSPLVRWDWKKTIGPLPDRRGRPGDWSYYNTNGLGLLEYLEWTEAMEIDPVLAVYSGFSLDVWGQNGASYPPDRMAEIVQDALDELEYCMGDTSTKYGALRAAHGHPAPFKIPYVEIGNEDWFSSTYPYRFEAMYNGLKAKYPDIVYISSAFDENPDYNITIPPGNMWDWHSYQEPSWFLNNFNLWDNWQEHTNNTNVTVLLGEYSAIQIDTPDGNVNFSFPVDEHIFYPRLLSAIAEGVYAIGAERNPNTVKMSSYAPSLCNRNSINWTPDMISYDANTDNTVLSASYWEQWLFSHYHGTHTLPVTNTGGQINPLFWVASIDENKNVVYLKVINTLNQPVVLTVDIPAYKSVNGTILTADDLNSYNYINNKTQVVPQPLDLSSAQSGSSGTYGNSSTWAWQVPKFSINVLQFNL
ncbi:glycoside hydrolase family 51 protein [Myriangium duriaei CBS 260.36]|uniref:non-reducing end alpha-L-arabinofuranosidase n=1 Tax=Myriangium duriaei CBS 260.36 TaxID=1168546 RepID=A0A9P4IS71_9PEZI|nr:glycoside hydrolase family 51 protein [Myriangium duriaei CBS 260.36]